MKKTFTLVELLVVISILSILSSIGIFGSRYLTNRTNINNAKTQLEIDVKKVLLSLDPLDSSFDISNGLLDKKEYETYEDLFNSIDELKHISSKISYYTINATGYIRYDLDSDYYAIWNLSNNLIDGYKN